MKIILVRLNTVMNTKNKRNYSCVFVFDFFFKHPTKSDYHKRTFIAGKWKVKVVSINILHNLIICTSYCIIVISLLDNYFQIS